MSKIITKTSLVKFPDHKFNIAAIYQKFEIPNPRVLNNVTISTNGLGYMDMTRNLSKKAFKNSISISLVFDGTRNVHVGMFSSCMLITGCISSKMLGYCVSYVLREICKFSCPPIKWTNRKINAATASWRTHLWINSIHNTTVNLLSLTKPKLVRKILEDELDYSFDANQLTIRSTIAMNKLLEIYSIDPNLTIESLKMFDVKYSTELPARLLNAIQRYTTNLKHKNVCDKITPTEFDSICNQLILGPTTFNANATIVMTNVSYNIGYAVNQEALAMHIFDSNGKYSTNYNLFSPTSSISIKTEIPEICNTLVHTINIKYDSDTQKISVKCAISHPRKKIKSDIILVYASGKVVHSTPTALVKFSTSKSDFLAMMNTNKKLLQEILG